MNWGVTLDKVVEKTNGQKKKKYWAEAILMLNL